MPVLRLKCEAKFTHADQIRLRSEYGTQPSHSLFKVGFRDGDKVVLLSVKEYEMLLANQTPKDLK